MIDGIATKTWLVRIWDRVETNLLEWLTLAETNA